MNSELFSSNNVSCVRPPILMDQISFKCVVRTAHSDHRDAAPVGHRRGRHQISVWNNPLTDYFADPRLYPQSRFNQINPCGRKVVVSGGKRVYRAEIGKPLPHRHSPLRAPQEKQILRDEDLQNQFTDAEMRDLAENSSFDRQYPYRRMLAIAVEQVAAMRKAVILEHGLSPFNDPKIRLDQKALTRLELYIEFPAKEQNEERLRALCHDVLLTHFGRTKMTSRQVMEVTDDIDCRPTFLKWSVPQKLFDKGLLGKANWFIKLYRKGGRLRIEIQANTPGLTAFKKKRTDHEQFFDDELQRYAQAVATIMERHLIGLHDALIKADLRPTDPKSRRARIEATLDQIMARCQVLLKTKADSTGLRAAMTYLAQHGSIDRKTFKSHGLDARHLKVLADPNYGFLSGEIASLVPANKKLGKAVTAYVLVREWLTREGKKERRQVKRALIEQRLNSELFSSKNVPSSGRTKKARVIALIQQATGSATTAMTGMSAIQSVLACA